MDMGLEVGRKRELSMLKVGSRYKKNTFFRGGGKNLKFDKVGRK